MLKSFHNINDHYLSLKNTNALKGIFSIFVVLCHIRGRIESLNNTPFGSLLTALGYLSVSVFFFFSAYGISTSYIKKQEQYISGFFRKRILPIYLKYLFISIVFLLSSIFQSKTPNLILLLKTFTFGGSYLGVGWYIQSILLLYILFYLICKICKPNPLIIFGSVAPIIYIVVCLLLNLSALWYECILSFILGVFWAVYNKKIETVLTKIPYLLLLLCSLLLFFSCFIIVYISSDSEFALLAKMLSSVFFVVFVNIGSLKINFSNKLTTFLGEISLEVYLIHVLFIMIFRNSFLYIKNDFLFAFLVLICSIITGKALNCFFRQTDKILKKG